MAVANFSRHRRGYYLYLIPGFVGLILIVMGGVVLVSRRRTLASR